jgi:hypothetical protein
MKIVDSIEENKVAKFTSLYEILDQFNSNKSMYEKLVMSEDENGRTILYAMIYKNLDISKFLEHVGGHLGKDCIQKLFKSTNENSFCSKICSIEDQNLVKNYLVEASKWLQKLGNANPSFDKFEEILMISALNKLLNDYGIYLPIFEEIPIILKSYNCKFIEYFAMLGLNHFLRQNYQEDMFVEYLLQILSHEDFKRFRTFFERNLDCEKIKRIIDLPSKILLKHCQVRNFRNSAFSVALQEKNIETFKFLIRSLTDRNAKEIIGKTLCYYFKEYKDECNILNVINMIKGPAFMETVLQEKFKLTESAEHVSLLFSSMNFNKNCLNLVKFCFQNFYTGDKTPFEKVLSIKDNQGQTFYDTISKSIQDPNSDINSKLFSKVYLLFDQNKASAKFNFLPNFNKFFTSSESKYKPEVMRAFEIWIKICKDRSKIYTDFEKVLKDSAFLKLSKRKLDNLINLENFTPEFIEHFASLHLVENLENESFLKELFETYLIQAKFKDLRKSLNSYMGNIKVDFEFVGSILKNNIFNSKTCDDIFFMNFDEGNVFILKFLLNSILTVTTASDNDEILIKFFAEKVFYKIIYSPRNSFDLKQLEVFKEILKKKFFYEVFLYNFEDPAKGIRNLLYGLLDFSNKLSDSKKVVETFTDNYNNRKILNIILLYRDRDNGGLIHYYIKLGNEKTDEVLQTISDFISTLIRKGVDKSEIKNFLLVEDKDGNSFVHLLGDHKIRAVDLSKIFNNLFKFDKNIIEKLLLHKNNDSRTFYSHYYHYHSNSDKTELGNFLKDILLGLDETKQIEIFQSRKL